MLMCLVMRNDTCRCQVHQGGILYSHYQVWYTMNAERAIPHFKDTEGSVTGDLEELYIRTEKDDHYELHCI